MQVFNLNQAVRENPYLNVLVNQKLESSYTSSESLRSSSSRSRKNSVGIVSYCNYKDPTFPLPTYSRKNKQAYADHHGYSLYHLEKPFVSQFHPWMNKLLSVILFLLKFNYADFHFLFCLLN